MATFDVVNRVFGSFVSGLLESEIDRDLPKTMRILAIVECCFIVRQNYTRYVFLTL